MATLEAQAVVRERAPDVRGPSAPFPATTLGLGIASIALILAGSLAVQVAFAVGGEDLTPRCLELGLREVPGAAGVCQIVEGLASPAQTAIAQLAILLGLVAMALGFGGYRGMDSRRKREQCITGAVLGGQGVVLSLVLLWFRSGQPDLFAKNFLNVGVLEGYAGQFARAAWNTIQLAFGGEIGGILIGLLLAVLVVSKRPAVRAPARVYINFFRGTPLIWQLTTGGLLLAFGFDIRINPFVLAILIFSLNTGAYAAEVFRAGIQSIERGQMEAARSLGMTYVQAMRYAIVPQAVRRVIPPLMNEFVILIKDTSLVLGVGLFVAQYELFTLARSGQAATFNASFFTAAAAGYLIVTLPLIWVVNQAERRLRSGLVGIAGAQ
jgi:His/Glu/Gln/Arg/opine family amino acid ABC transporter permease subunit